MANLIILFNSSSNHKKLGNKVRFLSVLDTLRVNIVKIVDANVFIGSYNAQNLQSLVKEYKTGTASAFWKNAAFLLSDMLKRTHSTSVSYEQFASCHFKKGKLNNCI